jgi:hypothetical protein
MSPKRAVPGFIAGTLLLAVLTGCSGPAPHVEETLEGDSLRVVLSRAEPPYPVPWRLDMELSIGQAYGDENYMLGEPRTFTLLKDGTVVILEGKPLCLKLFGPDGSYLQTFAGAGNGPGDLQFRGTNTCILTLDAEGNLVYWSGWPTRRQVWDREGRLLRVDTLPQNHPLVAQGRPYFLGGLGERLFAFYVHWQTVPGFHTFWTSDWRGDNPIELFRVATFDWESLGADRMYIGMAQAASDYTPMERLLVTKEGRIYFSAMDEDWIREFDADTGHQVLKFRLALEQPETITEADVEEMRNKVGRQVGDGLVWWKDHYWASRMVEGPDGEIWVQRTGGRNADGVWPTDVFTPDGRYRGRLFLPFAPMNMKVSGRVLYALGEGEESQPILARYRLIP